jgi:DNA-binding transcriptional LysR family regulator
MELRHLRYFCAVAEHQSFTLAAKRLHVSQSGVSGQVRDLEREIGVKLLQRTPREVSLTPEGAIFLREAREILNHSERAVDLALRASRGQFGKLTIGLCGPATAPFLPRLIRSFRKSQPGVNISLKDIDPMRQPELLRQGAIDIGFTRSLPPQFRSLLQSEVLFSEPLVAVLPKGHAHANEQAIHLAQLAEDRFVLYSREAAPDLFDVIVTLCKKAKFSPNIVDSPHLWQSVLTMVEAGEGVAIVPACVQHLRSNALTFHPLLDRRSMIDVILAWRNHEADAIRDGFLNLLRGSRPEILRLMQNGSGLSNEKFTR